MKKIAFFLIGILIVFSEGVFGQSQIIITIAGTGTSGFSGDGDQAIFADIFHPDRLTIDHNKNIYIVDIGNDRIRKINSLGIISTIAGNGIWGYSGDGGMATNAELNNPVSVAVDKYGNIYIAEQGNNVIRKVDTVGVITTIAGNGIEGYSGDGVPATTSELYTPSAVVVDVYNNIYISDMGSHRIRKVDSFGIITTIAGNGIDGFGGDGGPVDSSILSFPSDLAIDIHGNIFIGDDGNHRIRKISAGIISTVAGNGSTGFSGDGGTSNSSSVCRTS